MPKRSLVWESVYPEFDKKDIEKRFIMAAGEDKYMEKKECLEFIEKLEVSKQ